VQYHKAKFHLCIPFKFLCLLPFYLLLITLNNNFPNNSVIINLLLGIKGRSIKSNYCSLQNGQGTNEGCSTKPIQQLLNFPVVNHLVFFLPFLSIYVSYLTLIFLFIVSFFLVNYLPVLFLSLSCRFT